MGVMERLCGGGLVVLDGATGTELEARGSPQSSEASWAECSVTNPDIVRSVHEDYVRSGADVITTNTYSTGPHVLRRIGREDAITPWNSASVAIAREAISSAADGREVLVAGSVSAFGNGAMRYPSMDGKFTWGEDNPDLLGANFHEQIAILVEAGVDLVLLEFLGATADDIEIGLGRALAFDLPVIASLSATVDGEGRAVLTAVTLQSDISSSGTTAAEAVRRIALSGVTAICAMHSEIDEIETILPAIRFEWSGPVGAYPNRTGFWNGLRWVFTEDVTPEGYARKARRWVELGASIIGCCCGTTPAMIAATSARLRRDNANLSH